MSALDARAGVRARGAHPALHASTAWPTRRRATSSRSPSPPCARRRKGWRDQSFRWFSRKPPNRAVLVFTDDPRFDVVATDPWAPPPERPLPAGVEVTEAFEAESIRITTSRPGHPLLVKVSYHPRWRAEGADGPYLASPGFMLIVPRQRDVRLVYAARTGPTGRPRPGRARRRRSLPPRPRRRRRGDGPRRAARRGAAAGRGPVGALPVRAAPRARRRGGRAAPRAASPRTPARVRRARRARLPGLRGGAVGGRRRVRPPRGRAASVARPAAGRAALRPRRGAPPRRSRARGGRAVHARRRGRAGAAPPAGAALGRPRPRGGGRPGGRFGLAPAAPRGVPRNAVGAPSRGRPAGPSPRP